MGEILKGRFGALKGEKRRVEHPLRFRSLKSNGLGMMATSMVDALQAAGIPRCRGVGGCLPPLEHLERRGAVRMEIREDDGVYLMNLHTDSLGTVKYEQMTASSDQWTKSLPAASGQPIDV